MKHGGERGAGTCGPSHCTVDTMTCHNYIKHSLSQRLPPAYAAHYHCCLKQLWAGATRRRHSEKQLLLLLLMTMMINVACRICFEQETKKSQDPNNPLICPCQCSGSSKFVHRQCLQQWRETKHRADAFYQCEVCKYRCVCNTGSCHGSRCSSWGVHALLA